MTAPRPRILFLTQVVPYPLDSGPKVRAYHVLRWLSARADVHLVTFVRADDPPAAIDHLRTVCADVDVFPMRRTRLRDGIVLARSLATGASFIVARDTLPGMRSLLEQLVAEHAFDAVHADQLWMAQYARDLALPLKVLDQHNAVYRIFRRLAAGDPSPLRRVILRRESRRLARYEAAQIDAFDHELFVSETDRQAIRDVSGPAQRTALDARSTVIPICVDLSEREVVSLSLGARRITVLGTMYWPPNIEGTLWLADRVLAQVLAAVPDAVLTIVGKRPPAEIEALCARFRGNVEVTGYVADPAPLLAETAAFAVPLLSGGGMRVKILDAWAWGLPVVSTTIGAEGIDVRPGEDILIADAPSAFATVIIDLLRDPARRARLAAAGRAAVAERYDARVVYERLGAVYAGVLGPAEGLPNRGRD